MHFSINLSLPFMKKIILFGLAVLLVLTVTVNCKKKKDDGGTDRCGEVEIKVATIPANGTVDPPQPGTSFPLIVNIETMPSSGASVIVTAKLESGGAPYFTDTLSNATASNSFEITNTPTGSQTCVVNVTVTSATCNTNTWTGSYRYSAK
jgi:hypothetical protein